MAHGEALQIVAGVCFHGAVFYDAGGELTQARNAGEVDAPAVDVGPHEDAVVALAHGLEIDADAVGEGERRRVYVFQVLLPDDGARGADVLVGEVELLAFLRGFEFDLPGFFKGAAQGFLAGVAGDVSHHGEFDAVCIVGFGEGLAAEIRVGGDGLEAGDDGPEVFVGCCGGELVTKGIDQ